MAECLLDKYLRSSVSSLVNVEFVQYSTDKAKNDCNRIVCDDQKMMIHVMLR
jgi:hypothetical protein